MGDKYSIKSSVTNLLPNYIKNFMASSNSSSSSSNTNNTNNASNNYSKLSRTSVSSDTNTSYDSSNNNQNISLKADTQRNAPVKRGVPIRETLKKMGFSNDSIGYNEADGTVTLNGKRLMIPEYIDEDMGISYSSKKDIEKSLVDYYAGTSNPIVRVSDAFAGLAGNYGISADALSYGNGNVLIGGMPLDIIYTDDSGKAWAWQDDVYDVTSKYIKSSGVKTPDYLASRYEKKYLSDIWDSIYDLNNTEDFTYNPNNDPIYKAYREKYLREGNRAAKNTMAQYSALTGGYVNSSAATAGALASNYYASQLTDKIPDLATAAYNRYVDTYQRKSDSVSQMLTAYNTAYQNAYEANNQTVNNINSVFKSAVDRDNDAYKRNTELWKQSWEDMFNRQSYNTKERENYWSEIFNDQSRTLNDADIAIKNQQQSINDQKIEAYELDNVTANLNNKEKEIYLQYYNRLLEAEISGDELSNSLSLAQRRALYGY